MFAQSLTTPSAPSALGKLADRGAAPAPAIDHFGVVTAHAGPCCEPSSPTRKTKKSTAKVNPQTMSIRSSGALCAATNCCQTDAARSAHSTSPATCSTGIRRGPSPDG